ncbi:hypothetical protein GRS48_06590 [Halorubrum sp. JWXQ-INN 858]|uniref:hypothetical protein n=1 Tax=Halorubrum sp. JWXQ-INN 858 TaxID=2690782 RepID=UPI00135A2C2B|nr:hypothetical protein [Halorubrum sp. JWXQ-INN 858]MWV64492.1 hypothetical protein [Halorubrum sp. JWXQ-INN 858]
MDNDQREELYESLEQRDFEEVLEQYHGSTGDPIHRDVTQFGEQILNRINNRRIGQFQEPLNLSPAMVGYLALMYESETGSPPKEGLIKNRTN